MLLVGWVITELVWGAGKRNSEKPLLVVCGGSTLFGGQTRLRCCKNTSRLYIYNFKALSGAIALISLQCLSSFLCFYASFLLKIRKHILWMFSFLSTHHKILVSQDSFKLFSNLSLTLLVTHHYLEHSLGPFLLLSHQTSSCSFVSRNGTPLVFDGIPLYMHPTAQCLKH